MNKQIPAIAVTDFGKTHAKVCVAAADGKIAAERRRSVPVNRDGAYPYLDVDTLGEWLLETLAELACEFDIHTIIPVAHGAGAALIASDTRVLPIMDYEWPGVAEIDAAYQTIRPAFVETQSPALGAGLNLGRQLYWLSKHKADAFARAESILCYPQYWVWLLSGTQTGEVTSLGCHSDLWDPNRRCLSSLVDRAGWRGKFPPLSPAWATAGKLRPNLAIRTGLSPDCEIKTGIHDSNASYLRHLVSQKAPFTVVSTGTWIIMMAASGDPSLLDETQDMLANVDAYAAPVPSARFMGGREFAEIAGHDGLDAVPTEADITDLVANCTLALPSFSDGSGPFAHCAGRYHTERPTEPAKRASLATLYCALVCDYALSRLAADRGPLIIEGSFIQNPLFAPLLAQLRNQPVEIADENTGTVAGALLLAGDAAPRARPSDTRPIKPLAIPNLTNYRKLWRSWLPASD